MYSKYLLRNSNLLKLGNKQVSTFSFTIRILNENMNFEPLILQGHNLTFFRTTSIMFLRPKLTTYLSVDLKLNFTTTDLVKIFDNYLVFALTV